MRHENDKVIRENNELHTQMIKIKDENAANLSSLML